MKRIFPVLVIGMLGSWTSLAYAIHAVTICSNFGISSHPPRKKFSLTSAGTKIPGQANRLSTGLGLGAGTNVVAASLSSGLVRFFLAACRDRFAALEVSLSVPSTERVRTIRVSREK
jgi:hypothetical protein